MTSEFVVQVHLRTSQQLLANGATEQQIREHLRNVWLSEAEVESVIGRLPTSVVRVVGPRGSQPR